jgi:hypothetical protein
LFFRFDLQGWITVIGGLLLGLITVFTGYDYVDFFGRATVGINQQVGLLVLVASLATLVVVDAVFSEGVAQLASRRRHRDQIDRARAANAKARERDLADRERQRAARRAQRQDRCTLAQLEFQFSPTAVNRQRLSDLIALLREYGELA